MLGSETRLSLRVIWDLTLRSSGRGVRAETRERKQIQGVNKKFTIWGESQEGGGVAD